MAPSDARLVLAIGAALLFTLATQIAFNSGRVVSFVCPLFALALGTLRTLAVLYLITAIERERVHDLFARFVPADVVDEVLARTDDNLRLGAVELDCTVLFTDLRGFTSFSETQPAKRVIEVVNCYLNEMTEAILAAGGTLIAYMGDGIMAVFGAPIEQPDHADRALRCGERDVGPRLDRFNDWLAEQGHDHRFQMGVGLNSGPVMAGNIGSERRVEYTAIGDTTNTASRLESMTKGSGHMLFVADSTRERMHNPPDSLTLVGGSRSAGAWPRCPSGRSRRPRSPTSTPSRSQRQAIDACLEKRKARGGVPGDAVHASTREGGRAAEVETPHRCAIGGERGYRAEEQLVQGVAAPAHVSVEKVGVAPLQVGGREHVTGEDPLAKARAKRSTSSSMRCTCRSRSASQSIELGPCV